MQFLADEGCDAIIVRTLRANGHDVTFMAEIAPGQSDAAVQERAFKEGRILIVEDLDFSDLIFRDQKPTRGIILVRIPDEERAKKGERILALVNEHGSQLLDSMTVLTLDNIRIRPKPV